MKVDYNMLAQGINYAKSINDITVSVMVVSACYMPIENIPELLNTLRQSHPGFSFGVHVSGGGVSNSNFCVDVLVTPPGHAMPKKIKYYG